MSSSFSVITGASSGIGAAFADRLAAQGDNLVLVARRADRLAELADRLRSTYGTTAEILSLDLADRRDLGELEARLTSMEVGKLINNAGVGALGPTAMRGAEAQQALIDLNITALARLSLAALKSFSARDQGTLINVSSVIAFSPSAGGASYSGSKAFVLNFTRSLQMEYQATNIRIQALLPGPVRTEFFSAQGMDDSVFPESAYITAEDLVDASLAGLAMGEAVTMPTLKDPAIWTGLENGRMQLLQDVIGGTIARRYV